ncbi:hypothetical protein [Planotetraspora sp. GP83]|uniref:hypothetical protein n=1 Tax=Planotetraspora sp. GP83 TaxID=3156264 RepID=UPI003519C4ED
MICQHDGRTVSGKNLAVCLLVGASASAAFFGAVTPSAASAAERPQKHRKESSLVHTADRDPAPGGKGARDRATYVGGGATDNHGYQHTSTTSEDGATTVQNALCRHTRVCNITQKVTVVTADKPAQQTASTPQKVDAPAPVASATPAVAAPTPTASATPAAAPTPTDCAVPTLGLGAFLDLNATVNAGAGLLGG